MNSTQDEEEEEEENDEGRIRVEDEGQDREVPESLSDSEQDSLGEVDELGEGAAGLPPGVVRTQVPGSEYECGEDALMNETEQSYLRNFAREPGVNVDPGLISTSPPALVNMPVYASNLDQHIDRAMLIQDNTEENFYQPEPTLLTIASGAPPQVLIFAFCLPQILIFAFRYLYSP